MVFAFCGFMGSGKSTVVKLLGIELDIPTADLDLEIERAEGVAIADIFEQKGEKYFRSLESLVLEKLLSAKDDLLLALGGGTPCFNQNLTLLKSKTQCIYLRASVETLYKRLAMDRSRPLLSGLKNRQEFIDYIAKLLTEREACYAQANFTADIENAGYLQALKQYIVRYKNSLVSFKSE